MPFTDSSCLVSGAGTLGATSNPLTASSGIASFGNVSYTVSGALYIKATAAGLTSACSNNVTVTAGNATQLVLKGSNVSPLNKCSPAYTVERKDGFGNLTTPALTVSVNLVDGSTGTFYTDSGCTTSTTSLTIAAGASSQIFYYKHASAGPLTLTASDQATILSNGTLAIKVGTFTAISAGHSYSCAIVDGSLSCWGWGEYGNLGDGSALDSPVPVQVSGVTSGATKVSNAGETALTCAVIGGAAKCWGINANNQIGDGTTVTRNAPTQVSGLTTNVTDISVGWTHVCAVHNGAAKCWGYNGSGQLGDATYTDASTPIQVSGLSTGVTAIAAGRAHACALVSGGVKCWGVNYYGHLGNGTQTASNIPVQVSGLTTGVAAIAAGLYHSCALLDTGAVKCWGANYSGQLGDGTTGFSSVPIQVSGLTSGVTAIDVGSGADNTCAVFSGSIKCWGANLHGQIGDNTLTNRLVPTQVQSLTSGGEKVATGTHHSCAIANGMVQCWGYQRMGQLGDGKTLRQIIPISAVSMTSNVLQASAGANVSCALLVGGSVKCWGTNAYSTLGSGAAVSWSSMPVLVSGLTSGVTQISMGQTHGCAIQNGAALCWGSNAYGQLGDNSTTTRTTPVPVSGLSSGVTSVGVGQYSSCAVISGAAKCWGVNSYGQLGDGTTSTSIVPVQVSGLTSGVASISVGPFSACAILDSGAAKCWGYNSGFGGGTTPVAVSGWGANVTAISLGWIHICAIVGGAAQCMAGQNAYYGLIGDGTFNNYAGAIQVSGMSSGVTSITAGYDSTCAIHNGAVKCWGRNHYGQLGDGTLSIRNSPVNTQRLASGARSLSANYNHVCAVMDTGNLQCWGSDLYGETESEIPDDNRIPVLTGPWP